MRILVFEPLKEPYVKDIEDDIQATTGSRSFCSTNFWQVSNTLFAHQSAL